VSAFLIASAVGNAGRASAMEEFHPGAIWPDQNGAPINAHGGAILVYQGAYYWFGEHKIGGPAGNSAQVGVHVYSSTDLYHWLDQGIALAVSLDPANELAQGCILERPKVLYCQKTGKFVMWFHLEPKGHGYAAARSGIAVADAPAGPYHFIRSLRPNAGVWPMNVPDNLKKPLSGEDLASLRGKALPGGPVPDFPTNSIFRRDFAGGQMARDMTLFQDEDGAAYHVYASEENGTLHLSQLTEDLLSPAGKYVRLFPGGFNEAPALFKHRGRYFLITSGCTGWMPNGARLAVADSIWGPWSQTGNPCVGEGAEKTFEGQPTYVLPVPTQPDALIFMADRWRPENAIDGRYIWLPVQFKNGQPVISWLDHWGLGIFGK
jgi:hypothetical protein